MNNLLIVNDVHLGVKRSAGTTLKSRVDLGNYLHSSFHELICQHFDKDLVVVGDLFDAFQVDGLDLIRAYETLANWLEQRLTVSKNGHLTLIAGNHDYQPKADKVSSFHMLAHFLTSRFGSAVRVIDHNIGFSRVAPGVWAIPHMPNQDMFDAELKVASESDEGGWLLLHCNLMSTFAEHSDHSLNISSDQVRALPSFNLALAHEHQGRKLTVGDTEVTVIGNQFATSIADCLAHGDAQKDGVKRCLVLDDDLDPSYVETWRSRDVYVQIDWRKLDEPLMVGVRFVRVVGEATVDEAAAVINAIAAFRNKATDVFVVTNAVRVDGIEGVEDLSEISFDEIKKFNVLQALLDVLEEPEAKVIKELLNAQAD